MKLELFIELFKVLNNQLFLHCSNIYLDLLLTSQPPVFFFLLFQAGDESSRSPSHSIMGRCGTYVGSCAFSSSKNVPGKATIPLPLPLPLTFTFLRYKSPLETFF